MGATGRHYQRRVLRLGVGRHVQGHLAESVVQVVQ